MPSPFPGMDPYLDSRESFPDFHDSFITCLREVIQQNLAAPYYATIGRRTWIEMSQRFVEPDVNVQRRPVGNGPRRVESGGIAVAESVAARPIVVTVPHDERIERFLDICTGLREDKRLVTTVGILSRANKTPGDHGRGLYAQKQEETLSSNVNLVEFDFLRWGQHSTAIPEDWLRRKVPLFDYHVCIHRFDRLEDFSIYPILLGEPLPTVDIPLLPEHGAVTIDLQAIMNRCYDAGPYSVEIRYGIDPLEPPLTEAQQARVQDVMARCASGASQPAAV